MQIYVRVSAFNSFMFTYRSGMWHHTVIPCLTFLVTTILSNRGYYHTSHFTFTQAIVQMFQFLCFPANVLVFCLFVCLFFKIVAILMDMKWYFIIVLIQISLMINDVEHIFLC